MSTPARGGIVLKLFVLMCLPLLFALAPTRSQRDKDALILIYVIGLTIFLLYVDHQVNG